MYPFKKPKAFLFALIVCQSAGILGSLFTSPGIRNWYPLLNKPSFTPPNWIFGPVWISLFTLMAFSVYFVYISKRSEIKLNALAFFATQLFLNFFWSALFFGFQNPLVAAFEIVLLWMMIIVTLYFSYKVRPLAGILLIPYLMWVSFAAILNISIVLLNY